MGKMGILAVKLNEDDNDILESDDLVSLIPESAEAYLR